MDSRLPSGSAVVLFCWHYLTVYLGGKVVAELEVLEEGRHDDGGEEENDAPEEDVGDVGPCGATGAADKLATLFNAILQHRHVLVWRT